VIFLENFPARMALGSIIYLLYTVNSLSLTILGAQDSVNPTAGFFYGKYINLEACTYFTSIPFVSLLDIF
jgi:hypothetical protein